jgi:hypothetical protein
MHAEGNRRTLLGVVGVGAEGRVSTPGILQTPAVGDGFGRKEKHVNICCLKDPIERKQHDKSGSTYVKCLRACVGDGVACFRRVADQAASEQANRWSLEFMPLATGVAAKVPRGAVDTINPSAFSHLQA